MDASDRKFIRHPSDIPIEYDIEDVVTDQRDYLNNISLGGLSFRSLINISIGKVIRIHIPLHQPVIDLEGRVVWCKFTGQYYNVGVEFIRPEEAFMARMVEQVCYIESYKKQIQETEGRTLTGEQAAEEWIRKYAAGFQEIDGQSLRGS